MGEINFFPENYKIQNQKIILRLDLNVPIKNKIMVDDSLEDEYRFNQMKNFSHLRFELEYFF